MLNKYTRRYLNDLFLHLFKGLSVKSYMDLYLDSINWSKDKIEHYQIKKINELLRYSYENVPFYKKRFDDYDFNWQKITYLDDLNKLPTLTRADLQNSFSQIISKKVDLQKCKKNSSSGSTGKPVVFYHDQEAMGANRAAVLFCKLLSGAEFGDRWINIWGNPNTVSKDWKKFSSKISMFLSNEKRYPAFYLKDKDGLYSLYEEINQNMPDYIYGYTNAIYVFSKFIEQENLIPFEIKSVLTTAETLYPYQKISIEKNVGKVFDQYGCREINGIACETSYDNVYSVIEPRVYLEFGELVEAKNNVRKILVTDLYNKVFPLIRYETGDVGIPYNDFNYSKSLLNYKKIKSIEGRTNDIISLPSGGSLVVPNIISPHILQELKGINQYQIVYKEYGKLVINLLTDETFNDKSKIIIMNYIKDYLTEDIQCEICTNQKIIDSKTGKFKLFVDLTKSN